MGIGFSSIAQFLSRALKLWEIDPFWSFDFLGKASIGFETTPIMIGVGYIIGLRIALTMSVGGFLAWFLLISVFNSIGGSGFWEFFGISTNILEMDAYEIWRKYIRFVGAGAAALGGIIYAIKVLPSIYNTFKPIIKNLFSVNKTYSSQERDTPFSTIITTLGLISRGAIVTVLLAVLKIICWLEKIFLEFIPKNTKWLKNIISIITFVFFGFLIYNWASKKKEV